MLLEGKTAVVTGCNRGIGKSIMDVFANNGANIWACIRKPDEDFKNEKGNFELLYKTKKYGIPCERKFEVDSKSIVIGFVSNGCF